MTLSPSLQTGVRAALNLTLLLTLAGCSASPPSAAFGKWQDHTGKEVIEFRSDGTLAGRDQYGRDLSGQYRFTSPDHVQMQITTASFDKATGTKFVDHAKGGCTIKIEGDSLTMTDDAGSSKHYHRSVR